MLIAKNKLNIPIENNNVPKLKSIVGDIDKCFQADIASANCKMSPMTINIRLLSLLKIAEVRVIAPYI
ncbi:hypothetical protein KPTHUN262_15680 [Klebsiella pneumoniae]|nr:hypothetical protein KPZU40_27580 [Klebsiella pneumoniae]GHS65025.1 hypothetical protein KPTHUN262_15680 [Klebsiella pneumoniae]GMW45015.1 hypothetical protein LOCUS_53030 [Klebsiella pneumoniae]